MGCGVGVSRSSVENFLPHSAENFCRGTLQCFINFGYRKTLCLWGEYHDFLLKICCLTVPKIFVGEPFCVSQNFWYRKNLWIRGEGGVSGFFVKSFLSHSAEKFRRGTLQCVTNFGYRKILCFREFCHDFLLNFFCLTVPKIFVEDPSVFQRISGSENVYAYEGKISIFYGKFVLSQYRKTS